MPISASLFHKLHMSFEREGPPMPGRITPYAAIRARLDLVHARGKENTKAIRNAIISLAGPDSGEGTAFESFFSRSGEGENAYDWYLESLQVEGGYDRDEMDLMHHPPNATNDGGGVSSSSSWGWGVSAGLGLFGPVPTGHVDVSLNHGWTTGGTAQLHNFEFEDHSTESRAHHKYSLALLKNGTRYEGDVPTYHAVPPLAVSDFNLVEVFHTTARSETMPTPLTFILDIVATLKYTGVTQVDKPFQFKRPPHVFRGRVEIPVDFSPLDGKL